jgi:ATP-dependent RNA helicase RhlE
MAITFVAEKDDAALEAIQLLMQQPLVFEKTPKQVASTTELLEFEKPVVGIPGKVLKLPSRENKGASFHEKKAKNKKVNVRYNHKKAMQEKYGKPKKKR